MKRFSNPRACATFLVAMLACVGNLFALDWANVPANVRDLVEMEFPGLVVEKVEFDDRGGSPIYAIKGMADGVELELEVTPDGAIVRAQADGIHLIGGDDDQDHDGMTDDDELRYGCDPLDSDTDDDAFPDGFEFFHHSDPLDPDSQPQIMAIRTECADGGGLCLVISVQTFVQGTFQLEFCDGIGGWTALGDPFAGDGGTTVFEFPLLPGSPAGIFRIAVKETPVENTGGTGSTGSPPCAAPESVRGMSFVIEDDDQETKTYVIHTATTGDMTEEEGGNIEFYPFDYTYEKTGPCSGTIRLTFPSDDEEPKGVVINLTYTAQGLGLVTIRRFEGNHFEDTETGTFRVSAP